MESVLAGYCEQPTVAQVSKTVNRIRDGENWQNIFPGISTLRLDTSGHGPTLNVRFTREVGAAPVRVVREGENAAGVALVKEVNLLDRYAMGIYDLADKVGLTPPRTSALVKSLGLREDKDCYKEFNRRSIHFKGYSEKALRKLKEALPNVDMDQIWRDFKPTRKQKPV